MPPLQQRALVPSSGEVSPWSGGPLCIEGTELVQYAANTDGIHSYGAYDFGGGHGYQVRLSTAEWPAERNGSLLLSWFSCEGNVHHMLGETIHPLWLRTTQQEQSSSSSLPPRVLMLGKSEWPPSEDGDCHSARFASLLALLPIDRQLLIGPGSAVTLRGNGTEPLPPPSRQCFQRSAQQPSFAKGAAGLPQAFYQWLASEAGVCEPPPRGRGAQVLLVRRNGTRRMVNLESVESTLARMPHVGSVKTVDLAELDALGQMRAACGATMMVGVHGQGNEWAHFLNGARGHGGGLLELHYEGWPCYYAPRMEMGDSRIRGVCQEHSRVMEDGGDPKSADVEVDLEALEEGAREILAAL